MGLFDGFRSIGKDYKKFGAFAQGVYGTGASLTNEGVAGLRQDLGTYDERLKDPLGPQGRSIFEHWRGNLSDESIRMGRSFSAGLSERARQSGGVLSPNAIAELEQQNQKDLAEARFKGESQASMAEAGMTLDETNKLFDRRERIRNSIIGVGQQDKATGLTAWLESLAGRKASTQAIINALTSVMSVGVSGASGAGGQQQQQGAWGF